MVSIHGSPNNPPRKTGDAAPAKPPTGTPDPGKPGAAPPKQEPKQPEVKDEAKYTNHGKDELKDSATDPINKAMDKKSAEKVKDPRAQELLQALTNPEVIKKIDARLANPEGDYEDMTSLILDVVGELEKPGGPILPGTRDKLESKFTGSNAEAYRDTLNRWIKQNYTQPEPGQTPEQRAQKLEKFLTLLAGGTIHICEAGASC